MDTSVHLTIAADPPGDPACHPTYLTGAGSHAACRHRREEGPGDTASEPSLCDEPKPESPAIHLLLSNLLSLVATEQLVEHVAGGAGPNTREAFGHDVLLLLDYP